MWLFCGKMLLVVFLKILDRFLTWKPFPGRSIDLLSLNLNGASPLSHLVRESRIHKILELWNLESSIVESGIQHCVIWNFFPKSFWVQYLYPLIWNPEVWIPSHGATKKGRHLSSHSLCCYSFLCVTTPC